MDLSRALIDWDDPDDEGSNTAHIAEHGLTPEEVESALFDENTTFDVSDSSGPAHCIWHNRHGPVCGRCVRGAEHWPIRSSFARSPPMTFPSRWSEAMKPTTKPNRTAEQRAEEEAVRRQHAANPIRQPAGCRDQSARVSPRYLSCWRDSKPYGKARD